MILFHFLNVLLECLDSVKQYGKEQLEKHLKPEDAGIMKAMLLGDKKAMNVYMNRVALNSFSYFDTGKGPLGDEPERFYHGFVLGLIVQLKDKYYITSNRESGLGRYDVMLVPKNKNADKAFIIEFKVVNKNRGEKCLEDALENALKQIDDKNYKQNLIDIGICEDQILNYGFAFEGKKVLVGKNRV